MELIKVSVVRRIIAVATKEETVTQVMGVSTRASTTERQAGVGAKVGRRVKMWRMWKRRNMTRPPTRVIRALKERRRKRKSMIQVRQRKRV
jgi:hypothetical protein